MPPKLRQRESRREVLIHTENSRAKSATNAQGKDPPQPPPSDPNREICSSEKEKESKGAKTLRSVFVHISKFIDSMGAYANNGDLCLREEKITLVNLHTTKQASEEDLLHYIHRFRDISLDCYANYEEGELVGVCIDNMLPKFQAHLENLDISRFAQLLQKARKMALLVKPHTKKPKEKKSQPQVLTVSTVNNKRKKSTERPFEKPPPLVPCTLEEMIAILNKWISGLFEGNFMRRFKMEPWTSLNDADMDEPTSASTAMTPATIKALQRNPRFWSLFNQLGLNPEACTVASEAIMAIAAESGAHCFTAKTHASRAFLETTNEITFTDEDMEVQYLDHQRPLYLLATINEVQVRRALVDTGSCINLILLSTIQAAEISQKKIQGVPMEIKGFGGIGEYTKGHIQLVLKVGPIIALTQFHVVDSVVAYHILLGRPWLHKHQLVSSIYHQCVKGRLNGKPIRIASNPKPFNQSESHFVEAALYDEVASTREASLAKPVKKLLSAGFIKPIQHPQWLSNIVPVKKKNGRIRCCVDFRNLNKACPKDEFPLPNMDLLIDSAAGHAMFSFMDGFSGYNQIFMSPKYTEKTTFRTPIGNFYYTVMPFGLKNAGATYQRTMTAMFHDMMHREIEDYVDDIVVKSKTREDHFGILKKVFERCRLYKLKMNPLKCAFGVSAGKFLGFLVHQRGIDVDSARAFAITTMKPPTTQKELKSFLGKLLYIRRFIPGLAAVTSAFAPLLKKGTPFHWSTECQQAFEKDAESRYSGAERSCLALIYASQRLRHYLLAHKVQLMTKSHPIRSLLQLPMLSSRLAQWLLQVSQYEIVTETPTAIKSPAIADLLTQFPGEDSLSISDEVPGEINEVFLADLADSTWTLRYDGSSTTTSGGVGIIPYKGNGEAITKSFKFDFPCSNNTAEYEAYLARLAIAYEMGIKHLRVISDSNLVVCQARGEFSLKEPSLAPYRVLAQKLEAKFSTFEIEHAQRNKNRYADALATLESQIAFEDLKEIKDYTLISRDLYRRLPRGVLAWCISIEEAKKKLLEVHEKTCGDGGAISFYRRLQQLGYFLPNISIEAADLQSQCLTCQFYHSNEEVCATFISTYWRTPFLEYLLEGILPPNPNDVYRLKRLALRYFVEGGTLFQKGFHGEPLRCLSLLESQMVMRETHTGECGEHQGKKRRYQCLLTLGYYLATMKKDAADFVKTCHTCQVQANLIHTHPTKLQNMATPWPFHTWGLDLIGPINPTSNGYIWIFVVTKYFMKRVEAIYSKKQQDVRELLEHYQVKHRRSTPYYPHGNGQAEATNRMLLRILSKMVFDYGNDWRAHLADVLWAYRSSPKTATDSTPFSLVYGTDTISLTELVVPSPRVMQGSELEVDANMCVKERMADLEGLDEAKELAKATS
uniref:RNA-directed DNA polymerase n=1 Tax=Fagus sylvatica TaxID=28930 RepID=A0A2N9GG70_FAGSY